MTQFRNFMKRSAGEWDSQRRYFYPKSNQLSNLRSDLIVEFISENEEQFQVDLSWKTRDQKDKVVSEGKMTTIGNEEELKRSVGYMTEQPTVCSVHMVDDDCVIFETHYSKMRFREEIRLVQNDTIRLRQTLGFEDNCTTPFLCGQYMETRKVSPVDKRKKA